MSKPKGDPMIRLKLARLENRLSQLELAEASMVPRHVIQLAEQGIRLPDVDQQDRLANALGTKPDQLFGTSPTGSGALDATR